MIGKMPTGPRHALVFLLLTATLPSTGQQPSPASSDLTIHTTVRRVVEDVVVTDAQGNAVHGLTQADFALKEDGKPQDILSFDVHDGTKPDFVPPKVPPLPPNTYVDVPSAPEQGPLYVILYDMVNTEMTDQAYARKALFKFIDSKPPGTRFAIFLNTEHTSLIQGFTQDRELLRDALTRPGPGPHLPTAFIYGGNYGKGNDGATQSLMVQLAQYLDGVPGRKNLIWMASSFPLNLYPDPGSSIPQDEVKRTIAVLTHAQIALYPLDLRGVSVDGGGSSSASVGPAAPGGAGPGPGGAGGGSSPGSVTGGVSQTAMDYLGEDAIAQATGGRAIYSNNNIADALEKATDAGASYYTLSYSPSNREENGEQRKIEVKLTKPGYTLSYRRYYYAISPDAKPPKANSPEAIRAAALAAQANEVLTVNSNDTLYGSIEHGAPMLHNLLFSTHVRTEGKPAYGTPKQMAQIINEPAYFRTRNRKKSFQPPPLLKLQKYVIDYLVIDALLKSTAAQTGKEPKLEFAVAGYDVSGRMVNGVINDATAAPPKGGEKASATFRVEQEIDLPLEAAWLRIVVRDTLTDRTGALEIPLPLKPEPPTQAAK
jgi:VWFA-related protein